MPSDEVKPEEKSTLTEKSADRPTPVVASKKGPTYYRNPEGGPLVTTKPVEKAVEKE